MSVVKYFFSFVLENNGVPPDVGIPGLQYCSTSVGDKYWKSASRELSFEEEESQLQTVAQEFVALCESLTASGCRFRAFISFWISPEYADDIRGLHLPSAFLAKTALYRPSIDVAIQQARKEPVGGSKA